MQAISAIEFLANEFPQHLDQNFYSASTEYVPYENLSKSFSNDSRYVQYGGLTSLKVYCVTLAQ